MIFTVAQIVSYLAFMTLHRATSSRPARRRASAWAASRPASSKADQVRLGIEGLGEQQQDVLAYPK